LTQSYSVDATRHENHNYRVSASFVVGRRRGRKTEHEG